MDGAAYALDYNVLFHRLDRMRLNDREYEETFELMKVIELAALEAMQNNVDD